MLLGRNLRLHLSFAGLALSLIVVGFVWYLAASHQAARWVGGGSIVGIVVGSIAAAIIGFELLLWPRKKFRKYRLGPTRYWLAGHIWFGLATGPLAFIHSGFRFGGTFTSTLMWLLLFVLVSGVYGWIMQIVIPRWMLGNLPSETITPQIDDVTVQNALDARRMLTVAYGPKPDGLTKLTNLDERSSEFNGTRTVATFQNGRPMYERVVVGAVQRRGLPRARSAVESEVELDPTDARLMWKEYAAVIDPYLLRGVVGLDVMGKSEDVEQLMTKQKAIAYFALLRQSCTPAGAAVLDRLERLTDQRRQFDLQRRAQFWLHSWIAVHASVSVLLGVLLVTHIVLALWYL